jgi:hypothetical protein
MQVNQLLLQRSSIYGTSQLTLFNRNRRKSRKLELIRQIRKNEPQVLKFLTNQPYYLSGQVIIKKGLKFY